jgi:hypothetical protein
MNRVLEVVNNISSQNLPTRLLLSASDNQLPTGVIVE